MLYFSVTKIYIGR